VYVLSVAITAGS